MKSASWCLALAVILATSAPDAHAQSRRPELAQALQQVEQGEFDAALLGLDGIIRTLSGASGAGKDLAQAYLFQGIAYVGLEQADKAKASFRQALALDRDVTLNRERFAPKIVQVFEEVRQEAPPKKGKTGLVLAGLGVVAAGGVAVAVAGGGDEGGGAPTVVETISGTLPAGTHELDCRQNAHPFSMSQPGLVIADLTSYSESGPLLALACVGNVSGSAGANCSSPVNISRGPGAGFRLQHDMPAGAHTLVTTRSTSCATSPSYVIALSHPR